MNCIVLLIIEVYKVINKNKKWSYCYSNNIIYSYSDFIFYELRVLGFFDVIVLIILLHIFYIILIVQLIVTLFFLIIRIKVSKKNKIFNIFIYIPNNNSYKIKNNIKLLLNKEFLKIIFLNVINLYIWGFPRVVLNNTFISLGIIKSFKKSIEPFNLKTIKDIFEYIYVEVYDNIG